MALTFPRVLGFLRFAEHWQECLRHLTFETMRLFVSIPLSPPIREGIADAIDALQRVEPPIVSAKAFKWVRPENLHVTLKFLGDVPEDRVQSVTDACMRAATATRRSSLMLASFAFHPPRRSARLIVGELSGDTDAVASVARHLEDELHALDFPRETRPYWPHITLARARLPMRLDATHQPRWAEWQSALVLRGTPVAMDAIELVQSKLMPAGPIYETLATFPLSSAAQSE